MIEPNKIYNEDCLVTMKKMPDNFVDLTVTSPPYDNLRTYEGYAFDFENVAKELYRVTKEGGVVVWVVGDGTIDGSETGTSFRQALYFKDIGFKLHDTMIYEKYQAMPQFKTKRYTSCFEFMFVLSKGKPNTCNYIMDKCIHAGKAPHSGTRKSASAKQQSFNADGVKRYVKEEKIRRNIWTYKVGINQSYSDEFATQHPAIFPEKLAEDHIISWCNEGELVYDPFMGSGTTAKMAIKNNRNYIGSELSKEYCDIIEKRIEVAKREKEREIF